MSVTAELYPEHALLTITCWCAFACWVLFGGFAAGIIAYNIGYKMYFFVATWQLVLVFAILLMIIFLFLRKQFSCPHCKRPVLVDTGEHKHHDAAKKNGVNYWGSVIIDILFAKRFTCMYCGTHYLTRNERKTG